VNNHQPSAIAAAIHQHHGGGGDNRNEDAILPRHLVYRGVPEASAPQMENMFGKDRRCYRSYNSVETNIHVARIRVVVNIDELYCTGRVSRQIRVDYGRPSFKAVPPHIL
jgi:hypothetical protein